MLESIERLRDCAKIRAFNVSFEKTELLDQLDAIEREVDERYIELPKDADGEYIHMNDEMESVYEGDVFIVKRLKYSEKHGWMIGGACKHDLSEYRLYASKKCRHHKPLTVEDVLNELCTKAFHSRQPDAHVRYKDVIAEYAKRLQLKEEK